MADNDIASLIKLTLIALFIGGGLLAMRNHPKRMKWLPGAAIWLAVLAGLVWAYQEFGPF